MPKPTDAVQGTLDVLILKVLAGGPRHGWGIAQQIRLLSDDVLTVYQGSLYPALHRLEQRGWITAAWSASEHNRRARFYSLTRTGRRELTREEAAWRRLSDAVSLVLRRAGP